MADRIEERLKSVLNPVVGSRVYPIIAPQGVVSGTYITYHTISTTPEFIGADGATLMNRTRMQIDCWGDSYAAVRDLASDVAGAMFAADFKNLPRISTDAYEAPVKKYRVILDYSIWWR